MKVYSSHLLPNVYCHNLSRLVKKGAFYAGVYSCLIFLMVSHALYAQNVACDSLEKRLKMLEKSWSLLQDGFENKKVELKNASEKEFTHIEREFNNKFWYVNTASLFLSIISIGAVIGWFVSRKRWIKSKLAELFECELHDNRNILINMITQKESATRLKTEKKILVVSPAGADLSFFKMVLTSWGFKKNVSYAESNESFNTGGVDIVILNNSNGKYSFDEMLGILKTLPPWTHSFYFGTRDGSKKTVINNGREETLKLNTTNFANTEPQLFGNLMNLLYYHDAVVKNKPVV